MGLSCETNDLVCEPYTNDLVENLLQCPRTRFAELAVLVGNDYSAPHVEEIFQLLRSHFATHDDGSKRGLSRLGMAALFLQELETLSLSGETALPIEQAELTARRPLVRRNVLHHHLPRAAQEPPPGRKRHRRHRPRAAAAAAAAAELLKQRRAEPARRLTPDCWCWWRSPTGVATGAGAGASTSSV